MPSRAASCTSGPARPSATTCCPPCWRRGPGAGSRPRVTIANTHLLCHALAHFELDLALIEGRTTTRPGERTLAGGRDAHHRRPGHPLADQLELPLRRLAGETWVLREAQSGSREQFEQQLQPHLPRWQAGIELNTLEAVMLAVEKGLGISFISRLAVADRLAQGRLVALTPSRRFPASSPSSGTSRSSTPSPCAASWPSAAPRPWRENPSDTTRAPLAPLSFSRCPPRPLSPSPASAGESPFNPAEHLPGHGLGHPGESSSRWRRQSAK